MIFPERKTATRSLLTTEVKDYLGCSYRLDKFPLGTAINIGSPIIDINKIRKEEGFYVQDHYVGIQEMEPFSYSTFDRYTLKSKDTEKVTTGFNINVKLFSFGNKKTVEEVFTKDVINESKRVYGQLEVSVLGVRHKLSISSNLIKKIKLNYLNKTFLDELHSLTMKEFINTYGSLVLVDFYSGGRLTALYSGIYNSNDVTETKEKNIDQDIKATFGSKKDTVDVTTSIGLGRDYYREEATSQKISGMKLSIKAIGGNLNYAVFSAPQDIKDVNIDLSKWMASLTPETYNMIDIENEGLLPLSELISEINRKASIDIYLQNGETDGPAQFIEPYIEIIRRKVQGLTVLYSSLVSKTDDRILLTTDNITNETESGQEKKIQELVNTHKKVYGLKTVLKEVDSDLGPLMPSYYMDFARYDVNQFKKYVDKENNMMYLICDGPTKKSSLSTFARILSGNLLDTSRNATSIVEGTVCWSLYDYEKTLKLYGLTDFVNGLPEVTVDREDLLDYTIFGL